MNVSEFKDRKCPYCANTLNAASHGSETRKPKADDISMCFYCGELSLFGEENFVELTQEQRTELREHLSEREQEIQLVLQNRYQERIKWMS